MDKIILHTKEIQRLLDLGKLYFTSKNDYTISIPFEETVEIILPDSQFEGTIALSDDSETRFLLKMYSTSSGKPEFIFSATTLPSQTNFETTQISPQIDVTNPRNKKMVDDVLEDGVQILNAYVVFCYILTEYKELGFIEKREVKTLERKQTRAKSKNKKQKNSSSRIVRATHNHFYIQAAQEEALLEKLREKTDYTWHTSEFTRRGHWRTYKNGRKIWIKQQVVKPSVEEKNPTDKTYRL